METSKKYHLVATVIIAQKAFALYSEGDTLDKETVLDRMTGKGDVVIFGPDVRVVPLKDGQVASCGFIESWNAIDAGASLKANELPGLRPAIHDPDHYPEDAP